LPGFIVFARLLFEPTLGVGIPAQEERSGLAEGPAQIRVADAGATGAVFFTRRFTLAFDQAPDRTPIPVRSPAEY